MPNRILPTSRLARPRLGRPGGNVCVDVGVGVVAYGVADVGVGVVGCCATVVAGALGFEFSCGARWWSVVVGGGRRW